MAKKNKLTIDFDGFETLQNRLKAMGGNAKKAAENALVESHNIITRKVNAAMIPHRESGRTERAIIETPVIEWTGDTAAVNVGFNIGGGGLASIFLMYGTKLHGQPHIAPDRKLYNAVYGAQTRREIRAAQEAEYRKMLGG